MLSFKLATRLKMPISTKSEKQLELLQTSLEEDPCYFAPTHNEKDDKRDKKFPKDHCYTVTEKSSI